MYSVYILRSKKTGRYYCGQTVDFDDRIKRHNEGRSKSTKHGIPWLLVHKIELENRSTAILMESKIKKRGIERYLLDHNILKHNV